MLRVKPKTITEKNKTQKFADWEKNREEAAKG